MGVGLFVLSGVALMVTGGQFRALGGREEPLGLVGCAWNSGSEQDPEI